MSIQYTSQIATKPFLTGEGIHWLEKEDTGRVTLEDIKDALEEFKRLFKAGFASKAEILTLSRAFPNNPVYLEAAGKEGDDDPMVIGGPASVELIDREGHLITTGALKKAFEKFMENFRTRNAMVLHSDVQVGWALPAYISKGGQIFKSGVDDKGLFFICEVRGDTKIAEKVKEQIDSGRLKSYSIAGSATKVQNMQKGTMPYMQVDEMELAEVTVCEKGVNQGATFELLKAEVPQTGKINKDQCGYRDASPAENKMGINCGHCAYYNAGEKTCDLVAGDIQPNDYCKVFAPCGGEDESKKVVIVMQNKGKVDFKKSFDSWMRKEKKEKDPLKSGESFATLHNFAGREAEHHQLLREYGFPSEQPSESSRYTPVVETETDDDGIPINIKPPWTVNEAGQDLGDKHDEDSPDYHKSAKAKARKSAGALQNMADLFLNKSSMENHEEDGHTVHNHTSHDPKLGKHIHELSHEDIANLHVGALQTINQYLGTGLGRGEVEKKEPFAEHIKAIQNYKDAHADDWNRVQEQKPEVYESVPKVRPTFKAGYTPNQGDVTKSIAKAFGLKKAAGAAIARAALVDTLREVTDGEHAAPEEGTDKTQASLLFKYKGGPKHSDSNVPESHLQGGGRTNLTTAFTTQEMQDMGMKPKQIQRYLSRTKANPPPTDSFGKLLKLLKGSVSGSTEIPAQQRAVEKVMSSEETAKVARDKATAAAQTGKDIAQSNKEAMNQNQPDNTGDPMGIGQNLANVVGAAVSGRTGYNQGNWGNIFNPNDNQPPPANTFKKDKNVSKLMKGTRGYKQVDEAVKSALSQNRYQRWKDKMNERRTQQAKIEAQKVQAHNEASPLYTPPSSTRGGARLDLALDKAFRMKKGGEK